MISRKEKLKAIHRCTNLPDLSLATSPQTYLCVNVSIGARYGARLRADARSLKSRAPRRNVAAPDKIRTCVCVHGFVGELVSYQSFAIASRRNSKYLCGCVAHCSQV